MAVVPLSASTAPLNKGLAATGAPLAGRIRPGVTYEGVATFYDADGGGACLYDPSGDVMTGAMNSTYYESAKACGVYVSVRAADGASAKVHPQFDVPSRPHHRWGTTVKLQLTGFEGPL
ncbi:hypothetical protein ACFWP7_18315 [Streptomyces sp. NPDC058470]|uniref:hypothetical protein n=1 Tax=Streptomyces sp. NPDC058470 TaxID=3346515 RepID=UPI00365ECF3C